MNLPSLKSNRALLFFLVLFSNPCFSQGPYDPTKDLNAVFGSRCESFAGPLVNTALSQGDALKGIIQSLVKDDDCRGVVGALDNLAGLNYNTVLAPEETRIKISQISNESSELEMALIIEQARPNPDPSLIAVLKQELYLKKVDLISEKTLVRQSESVSRISTIQNFQNYSNALFSALSRSQACITNHPNLLVQVGAQVLALSSTLTAGVTGALMLAGGQIINQFVTFLRDLKYAHQMGDLMSSTLGAAVNCALEAMASHFCQARDVQTVARQAGSEPNSTGRGALTGAGIAALEMPAFIQWSQRLTAGSRVSSGAQANEKRSATYLQAAFNVLKDDLDAIIAKTEKRIGTAGADAQNEIDVLIEGLAGRLVVSIGEGVLSSVFVGDRSAGPLVYLYTNGKLRECVLNQGESSAQCARRKAKELGVTPDLGSLKNSVENIVTEAGVYVASEVGLVKENDPQLVLAQVQTKTVNRKTAFGFLKNTQSYLKQLLADKVFSSQPIYPTILAALTRVEGSIAVIENPSGTPQADVTKLSNFLSPEGDVFFFSNEMREIVRQDLDQKIQEGKLDESLAEILQLSASDSLSSLIIGFSGLDAAIFQAQEARRLTKVNLKVMSEVFADTLANTIKSIAEEKYDEIIEHDDNLSRYCVRSLVIPSSPFVGGVDLRKYCVNRIMYSGFDRSGIMVVYNKYSDPDTSYSARACVMYDYFRDSRLHELKRKTALPATIRSQK